MPERPYTGPQDPKETASPRKRLRLWVKDWEALLNETRFLEDKIEQLSAGTGSVTNAAEIGRLQERRRDAVRQRNDARDEVIDIVKGRPRLKDEAIEWGFNEKVLTEALEGPYAGSDDPDRQGGQGGGGGQRDDQGGGGGTGGGGGAGGGGGGTTPNLRNQARDNRLLGKLGKEFRLVRGPGGMYVAEYVYRIDGETVRAGIKLGKDPDRLDRYGLKASDAKAVTKAQLKRIKSIGWADELAPNIRKGDTNVFKSLTRYLRNQYGGQAILEDDEVMSVVIANSMFGWSAGEFENRLRNTSWYKNTEATQREWVTLTSPKERRNRINRTMESVVNDLENYYGLDWMSHVKGGMNQARTWAEKIASGMWGTPDQGFAFWQDRQFDRAAGIENTPAWQQRESEQEEIRGFANRPEDMFETLRSQAMQYLGQRDGKPLISRETLKGWATDLVSENKSDGDWQQYLRDQMKTLHPYFDHNRSFTEQADPYRAMAESVFGTSISYDDDAFSLIPSRDADGNVTNQARSLYDFAQYLRDNDPRFWDNPQTEERVRAFGQEILSLMGIA